MRFPFDDQYEFDYEEEYESYRGMSPKMMALFMEDEMNRESKCLKNRGVVNFTPLHHSVEETGHQYTNHR